MKLYRLTLPLLIAIVFILFVSVALAQVWEAGDEYMLFKSSPEYPYNQIIYGDSENSTPSGDPENGWRIEWGADYTYLYFTPVVTTSVITLTADYYTYRPGDWTVGDLLIGGCLYRSINGTDSVRVERAYSDTCVLSPGISYTIRLGAAGGNEFWIRNIRLTADTVQREPEGPYDPCPTVDDYHFASSETLTDTWLLSGATITDSILTLAPGDIAAQNLDSLTSQTAYNAVISVTNVISDSILTVVLGTQTEQLTITGTGLFTASFTTPVLAGPLAYIFQSVETNTGSIDIDYTCLYRSDDNTQAECIAPPNGEFTTDDNWLWFNSARWWTPAQAAFLPHVDVGMVQTENSYSLPTLSEGEYLLLRFEAGSDTTNGIIGGRAWSGVATDTNVSYFYYETYPSTYHYEVDLSLMAGDENAQLIMGNVSATPPEGMESVGLDNIILDNVCIFVSDQPPQLPYTIDTQQPSFVDLGLNYTTCANIDGLWAWYGVNMAQYRATYEAGTSVWDPIGWVPWLISAIWVNLAAWSCLVMDIYAAFLSTVEYLLNNFLNLVFWLVGSWQNFRDWLNGWGLWLALSLANILLTLFTWLGDLGGWLAGSGLNLASWFWSLVSTLWVWLATYFFNLNGLRILFNWFIDYGFNPFMVALGLAISFALIPLVAIWNLGLFPFVSAAFGLVSMLLLLFGPDNMLWEFIVTVWDFVSVLFLWLWENVISVGHIPLNFYYAFDTAMNSTAYSALVNCIGVNFWCTFLAGVQIINQTVGHSIFYPIVIVGIVASTLWVLWINVKELFSINIQ